MQNISFKQYRNIDLTVLSVLLLLSEGITTFATTKWFVGVPFAISTTLIFIIITMMRWGVFAFIPAAVGGIVFSIASGAGATQFVIYTAGNLFALLPCIFLHFVDKEKVRKSIFLLTVLSVLSYVSLALGRWLVSLIFEPSIKSLLVYLTTDIVTLLFTTVILVLMRGVDGMIEDQRHYLVRLSEEREKEASKTSDGDDLESISEDPDYLSGVFDDGEAPRLKGEEGAD